MAVFVLDDAFTTVLLTIFVFCSIVYVSISSFVSVMYGYEL